MEKKINLHWPSIFLFLVGIITIINFFFEQRISLLLHAVGFSCLGYSSIRLVPRDFFTQKLSFSTLIKGNNETRQLDIFIQIFGFLLLLTGLVFSFAFGI